MAYWIKYDPLRREQDTPARCSCCGKIVMFREPVCPKCNSKMDMQGARK